MPGSGRYNMPMPHGNFTPGPGLGTSYGLWSRRDVLRVGSMSVASTLVPGFLGRAAAAENRSPSRAESVILLWMAGGVTHIDSFDPKPDAPEEIRGTLGSIATTLPGVHFCETMPCLARQAH